MLKFDKLLSTEELGIKYLVTKVTQGEWYKWADTHLFSFQKYICFHYNVDILDIHNVIIKKKDKDFKPAC